MEIRFSYELLWRLLLIDQSESMKRWRHFRMLASQSADKEKNSEIKNECVSGYKITQELKLTALFLRS